MSEAIKEANRKANEEGKKETVKDAIKIVIAGEGGQGVQSIGEIIAEAAFRMNREVVYIPNFGVEQRGGVSIAFVQIGDDAIGFPKFKKADMMAVLSERSVGRTRGYIRDGTLYLYDSSGIKAPVIEDITIGIQAWDTIAPEAFADMTGSAEGKAMRPPSGVRPIGIPAAEVANKELDPKVFNVIILGALLQVGGFIDEEAVRSALSVKFGDKFKDRPELMELNYKALERGKRLVEEMSSSDGE